MLPAIEFEAEPAPSVRDRVSAAVLGGDAATVHPVEPTRMEDAPVVVRRPGRASNVLFGRFAWAGAGAIVIAFALNGDSSGPSVAAAFTMAGTELAPGASGTARLSPVDGGSVAMRLVMRGLPPSRPGEFYELWWVGPDKRHISCGTVRADGSVVDLSFTTRRVKCLVESLDDRLDVENYERLPGPETFALNEIGRVTIKTLEPIFADPYATSRDTGSFILIDPATHQTVAGGMVRVVLG